MVRLELDGAPAEERSTGRPAAGVGGVRADGDWHEATVVDDETDGFLLGGGAVTLELPPQAAAATIGGHELHWLRCRVTGRPPRAPGRVHARAGIGCVRPRSSARRWRRSTPRRRRRIARHQRGRPGRDLSAQAPPGARTRARARRSRCASAAADELGRVGVRSASFAHSDAGDRHFLLDRTTRRAPLRPGDPPARRRLAPLRRRACRPARCCASRAIDTAAGAPATSRRATLTILATPAAGRRRRHESAAGGRRRRRARRWRAPASARALELRARTRAVTVEDFERLTLEASPRVARASASRPGRGRPGPGARAAARRAGRPPARARGADAGPRG